MCLRLSLTVIKSNHRKFIGDSISSISSSIHHNQHSPSFRQNNTTQQYQ